MAGHGAGEAQFRVHSVVPSADNGRTGLIADHRFAFREKFEQVTRQGFKGVNLMFDGSNRSVRLDRF
jgi:hypothetical protein